MKDFRKIFKELARSKALTNYHVIQRCILTSMVTYSFEPPTATDLADMFIRRAFTPITRKSKLDNGRTPYDIVPKTLHYACHDIMRFFDNTDELAVYKAIVTQLLNRHAPPPSDRYYFYVFVRQDISPEYQAVQACHAAAKMGYGQGVDGMFKNGRFDELYITLVGVPNIEGLQEAMKDVTSLGHKVYNFYEPDIGNELTAIASAPICALDRKRLLSYKRLKFINS